MPKRIESVPFRRVNKLGVSDWKLISVDDFRAMPLTERVRAIRQRGIKFIDADGNVVRSLEALDILESQ